MLSKKKKERWEERQKKIEEQAKEIDDAMEVEVILAKEDVNKAVVQAWSSSEKLTPYVRKDSFLIRNCCCRLEIDSSNF